MCNTGTRYTPHALQYECVKYAVFQLRSQRLIVYFKMFANFVNPASYEV